MSIDGRIFGGEDTPIESTPYQVSLQQSGHHFCGGAIYKSNIIVTAAHCVYNKNPEVVYVRAGTNVHNIGGSVVRVSAISVHDNYNNELLSNDVALLLLRSPLKLGGHVKTISLASSIPKNGAKSIVSGWGHTESEYSPSNLKSVNVNIVSRKKCARAYDNVSITVDNICAAAAGKDACQGDSGGPLVSDGKLVGIVSWGYDCADPFHPGVYASVPELRGWIVEETSRLSSV
ncbi:trypsin alpha-like [Drosophila innubila]|uniref:trypsin alpha-like n=1 Tax=Drosophila innubila TaxID=198719 RepID=UPI00148C2F01|nr:trypsin alpha-like [Drosophila innubila]